MSENAQQVAKTELSNSERFAISVNKEFQAHNGEIQVSSFQKKLAQNYFIAIDQMLKLSETKRLAKSEQYRDPLSYAWNNIDMVKLSVDVMAFSAIGLDPCQPNHLSIIPFKDKHTNKYKLTFIIGYVGLELKAKKYGYDIPKEVITEVVYSTDKFKQNKRNKDIDVESYDFEVTNDFDRGEIVGGFYYLAYDEPSKNRIRVFNMKDIEKRIPEKAAVEFWGGEKDVWKNGQKAGKEDVDGWKDEMVLKTLKRAAYNSIPIDSSLIDENLVRMIQAEKSIDVEGDVKYKIESSANTTPLDFEDAQLEDSVQNIKSVPASVPEANNIPTAQPTQAFAQAATTGTPIEMDF